MIAVHVGVGDEEVRRVPQGGHQLLVGVLQAVVVKLQVAHQHGVALVQVQAESVGAVAAHELHGVGVVLGGLGELLSVLGQQGAVDDAVFEGGPAEQRHGHHVHVIEPAADLAGVFHNEVAGEVRLEPILVFKGIMLLGVGDGAGFKPAVQHLGHAAHGAAALAGEGDLVHVLAVQVGEFDAADFLDFRDAAQHPAFLAAVAFPDGDGRAPVAVAGNVPVTGVFQPVAKPSVLDPFGHPVDLLVFFDQLGLDLFDVEVPGAHGLVNQRVLAAPAVGIVMHQTAVGHGLIVGVEEADDDRVHFDHVAGLAVLEEVGHFLGEVALGVHGVHDVGGNIVLPAGPVVILTKGRRGVHDANALGGVHVIRGDDAERAVLAHEGEVRQQGRIQLAQHILALHALNDVGRFAEHVLEVGQGIFAGHVNLLAHVHVSVGQAFIHAQRQVGGQRPGRGGPGQVVNGLAVHFGFAFAAELGDDPAVLPGPGGIGFAGVGNGQAGFAVHAVGRDAVAGIDQALVVAGLERPHDALHELGGHGLIGVVVVHPAGHLLDVLTPGLVVAGYDLAAFVVERGHAHVHALVLREAGGLVHRALHGAMPLIVDLAFHLCRLIGGFDAGGFFDNALVRDFQQLFRLVLDGQAVAVPAPDARHRIAPHGPVPGDHIFNKGNQHRAMVRLARGEGRAVVEHDLAAFPFQGFFKGVVLLPEGKHFLLESR